jgi:hypothetical protein
MAKFCNNPAQQQGPEMLTAQPNSSAIGHVGLGVAALLSLDLLAILMLGSRTALAIAMGAAAFALWLLLRAWFRGPRVAPRPAEHAQDAPTFVMGAPRIDARLWARVVAAMRVDYASRQMAAMVTAAREEPVAAYLVEHSFLTPFTDAFETQGDDGQDELRLAFVEAAPRSGTRDRRPCRQTAM